MTLTNLRLAWQCYQQEKNYSYNRFYRAAQIVLLVFIVTLSQTSDRIQAHLTDNLASLLGADVVLAQRAPLTRPDMEQLAQMTRSIVLTQLISTTLTKEERWQRATLKAVGQEYPLQGELKVANNLQQPAQSIATGPAAGEIWMDSRLIAGLALQVGEEIAIADQLFTLTKVLKHEPDRLMEGHNVSMRALISLADAANLTLPQDAIQYRYLMAAEKAQVTQIIKWQKEHLPAAQIFHKGGAHPLALFWQRTENLIGLASIMLFFMAAIAMEQLTRLKIHKEQHFCAVCMSIGASKRKVLQLSVYKWLLQFLSLLPVVLVLAAALHWLIIDWLRHTFTDLNWSWNIALSVRSIVALGGLMALFQIPVWISLLHSHVGQLIQAAAQQHRQWVVVGCISLALMAIIVVYSDNVLLTAMVVLAMAICVAIMLFASWLSLTLGEKLSQNLSGLLPFTLFMMKQRLVTKSTQILGVGLCAFLLLFTLMLLKDLGGTMEAYQRQHDGNLLVSQATEQQMSAIENWAQGKQVEIRQQKPFMYAKLIQINGQSLDEFTQQPSESMATLKRAVRLHWTQEVPANNRVVTGDWWLPETDRWQQVSVESEVMTDLGLTIGDSLTFFIADKPVEFTLVAGHEYKPGAGSITFWVQMPPAAMEQIVAERFYMASIELGPSHFAELSQLWQAYPSLRMVSIQELSERFDKTLAMVTQVISGLSAIITLLAGIVILSSIQSQEMSEKRKNSIIMSFGLSKRTCLMLNLLEWIFTGFIAAFGAIAGAYIAGLLIYQSQFSLTYQPDFAWLLATLIVLITTVTALGSLASKRSLTASIRDLLAE